MEEVKQVVPWFEMLFNRKVGEGAVIEENKAYLITFKERITNWDVEDLQRYLDNIEDQYGCKFLLLHGLGNNQPTIYDVTALMNGNWSPLLASGEAGVIVTGRKFRAREGT